MIDPIIVSYTAWSTIVTANPSFLQRWAQSQTGEYIALAGHSNFVIQTEASSADIVSFETNHKANGVSVATPDDAFAEIVATPTANTSSGTATIGAVPTASGVQILGSDGSVSQLLRVRDNGAARVESLPYQASIAQGHVPGHTNGSRVSRVTLGNHETSMLLVAGSWNEQTVAGQWAVESSSTSDTAIGTGARAVEVVFIDGAGVRVVEYLALNGTTPVPLASASSLYLDSLRVIDAGSGRNNLGDVSVKVGGIVVGQILPGNNQMYSAVQYTAANEKGFMSTILTVTSEHEIQFDVFTYQDYSTRSPLGGALVKAHEMSMVSGQSGDIPSTIQVPPNCKLEVWGRSEHSRDVATVSLFGWFEAA